MKQKTLETVVGTTLSLIGALYLSATLISVNPTKSREPRIETREILTQEQVERARAYRLRGILFFEADKNKDGMLEGEEITNYENVLEERLGPNWRNEYSFSQ